MKENYEEILFENKYTLSKQRFMEWGKENAFSGKRLPFAIYWFLFAIGLTVFACITKEWVALVLALFCLYRACIHWLVVTNNQYNILAKHHGRADWTRRILFQPESIQVIDTDASVEYRYGDITEIKENGNYVKLLANNGTVIRLYTDMFVETNWQECKKFILTKMQ